MSKSDLLEQIKKEKLWEHEEWLRLLHVRPSIFFYKRSEADSDNFFLDPNGKYDFKNELMALAMQVLKPHEVGDLHPVCRFPARTKWLYDELGIIFDIRLFDKCSEYKKYLKLVEGYSVSLVFSSYYLDSPASAFGHTLLRIKRPRGKYHQDTNLLDMGINSAAQVTTTNAFWYAIMGLVGGFEGKFSAIPYFYKVREYNDYESRDLWSYDLNLKPEHLKRMIDHLWEIGNASFDYYYFSENCSYNLLTLLEVADFKLDLISKLPFLYTVPSHTIQIINEIPGLVTKIYGTPSARKTFVHYFQLLDGEQQKILLKSYELENHKLILNSKFSKREKTKMMDVLIYLVDYKHPQEILLQKGSMHEWKKKILLDRSGMIDNDFFSAPDLPLEEAPHNGHRPRKVHFDLGHFKEKMEYTLGYRFALHSYMDPPAGQPKLSSLEFGDMEIFYRESEKVKIKKLEIIDVMMLNPWTRYHKPFSFKSSLGIRNNRLLCDSCTTFFIDGGAGITLQQKNSTFTFFVNSELAYSDNLYNDGIASIGPEATFKQSWGNKGATFFKIAHMFPTKGSVNYWDMEFNNYFYASNSIALFANISYFCLEDLDIRIGMDYFF